MKAISDRDLEKLINNRYGSDASQFLALYSLLDEGDRGEIRGEIKEKLSHRRAQIIEFKSK